MKKIKIIYNIEDKVDFLFISTFFNFCGISIEEICIDTNQDNIINTNDSSNIYIYIGQNQTTNSNIVELKNGIKNQTDENKKIVLEKMLMDLSKILNDNSIQFDANYFEEIIDIYVNRNLFNSILDSNYYRFSADKCKYLEKIFGSLVYGDLKNANENKYVNYAKKYCLQIHNKIHKGIDHYGNTLYDVYELFGRSIYGLFDDYKSNKELCLLIGEFICDDYCLAQESISWLETCIKHEDRSDIVSYLYKKISEIYGRYSDCSKHSLEYAKKSYIEDKNINSIYYLANQQRKNENYDEALSFYKLLIDKFSKLPIKYLTPKELIIYYLTCSLAAFTCCIKTKNYYNCFYYAYTAVKVYESINENILMQDLYNEDIERYKELLRSKMRIDKVYQYLAVSYRETKDYEEADKCWELVRKYQK